MANKTALASIPLLLGLGAQVAQHPGIASFTASRAASITRASHPAAERDFSIGVSNLNSFAATVAVTLGGIKIEGHSGVHAPDADCEMHFGAHAPSFQANPSGMVLEPMNVCQEPLPTGATWPAFGDSLVAGAPLSATGVARIWPEHLNGGGASNPDHAFELHPLLSIAQPGVAPLDLSKNVFAGDYHGGVSTESALKILQTTSVSVARNGGMADIQFRSGGAVGNFTTLDLSIDRASISADTGGSYRMNGEVLVDGDSTVQVRVVSAVGTAINDAVGRMKSAGGDRAPIQDALVLFSISPEALQTAFNRSQGPSDQVDLDRPIQLILFGTKDDR